MTEKTKSVILALVTGSSGSSAQFAGKISWMGAVALLLGGAACCHLVDQNQYNTQSANAGHPVLFGYHTRAPGTCTVSWNWSGSIAIYRCSSLNNRQNSFCQC